MILDFGCDIKKCDSPVEFVKGTNYQTFAGPVSILFLRCLNGHYYMKYKEDIPELQLFAFKLDQDDFSQLELPFEEDNE